MPITKIALTGGPCAGKSNGLSRLDDRFTALGYKCLQVPEAATQLKRLGLTFGNDPLYQSHILDFQIALEGIAESAAEAMIKSDPDRKILILCDRGAMDGKAFVSESDFKAILDSRCLTENDARDRYDAVFHLETAAKGAEKYYTLANNDARTETPEQARDIDDRLISSWVGHPHLRIIDNRAGFDDKIDRLVSEISGFLGEPEPLEIERKFLIAYPDLAMLEAMPNVKKIDISQTYLDPDSGNNMRVRQRGSDGSYSYFLTSKKDISPTVRIEDEIRISKGEYKAHLEHASPSARTIEKSRYCIAHNGSYFELDIYPFWNDRAVLEIELLDADSPVDIPEWVNIIKEVTGDKRYGNFELARTVGKPAPKGPMAELGAIADKDMGD